MLGSQYASCGFGNLFSYPLGRTKIYSLYLGSNPHLCLRNPFLLSIWSYKMSKIPVHAKGGNTNFSSFGQFGSYGTIRIVETFNLTNSVRCQLLSYEKSHNSRHLHQSKAPTKESVTTTPAIKPTKSGLLPRSLIYF